MARNELAYDSFWKEGGRLYRVAMEQYQDDELSFRTARSYRGLPALLEEELPEVEEMTRLGRDVITVFVGEQQIQDVNMFWADTNVFHVLDREILAAESQRTFPDIHSMAISENLAMKLYGTVNCIGEELRLNEGWIFYISTVFESIPENSHLQFDVLANRASVVYYMRHFDNNTGQLIDDVSFEYQDPGPYNRASWNNRMSYSYMRVKEKTDMDWLQEKADGLLEEVELPDRLRSATIVPVFQRIDEIHLKSDLPYDAPNNSSMFYVYMLILIASVVLVVSWINFINLFSVIFFEMRRDTAVRIINGADRSVIRREIFGKALIISLMSAASSFVLLRLFQELSFSFSMDWMGILLLLIITLLSAFLASLIPLVSFQTGKTIHYLKGEVFGRQGASIYRLLSVGFQFAASVILISSTLVMMNQMKFVREKDLGFTGEQVIYSFSPMTMNQRADIPDKLNMFRNEMERLAGVENFCVSSTVPGQPFLIPSYNLRHQYGDLEKEVMMERLSVDPHYFDLYSINFLAGTSFREDLQYNTEEIIINQLAAEELGYSDPVRAVGEFVQIGEVSCQIIGVTENYHHLSLKETLMPVTYFKSLFWWNAVGYYSFRLSKFDEAGLERIARIWSEVYPGEQFLYQFVEDAYMDQYESESRFSMAFVIAAILAILVSCMGLAGLSRYLVLKRTREIGIRKAYGYSSLRILGMLQYETLWLVLVSSAVGIPAAWFILQRWLTNFAYRIDPSVFVFILSVLLVYFFALAITFVYTWKAARGNPVDALRHE